MQEAGLQRLRVRGSCAGVCACCACGSQERGNQAWRSRKQANHQEGVCVRVCVCASSGSPRALTRFLQRAPLTKLLRGAPLAPPPGNHLVVTPAATML